MRKRIISVLVLTAVAALASARRVTRAEARTAAREAARVERETRDHDIAFFARRATEDPQSAADRAQVAGLYLQRARDTGDWENYHLAEAYARAALALRTDRNGKAYLTLASSLLARHEFGEAYRVAREMVTLAPDEPAYRALLGELQVELGDYEAARITFDTLRVHHRHPAVAPRLARWLELTGDRRMAEQVLRWAQRDVERRAELPAEQRAWFTLRLADFLVRHGRVGEAEDVARAGLAIAPDDGRLMLILARAAALRGAWRDVLRHVHQAGDAADISALALAGDAAFALGDTAGARVRWARAEQRGHEQPEPYNRQWTLFRLEHGVEPNDTRAILEREIQERRDVYGWDQLAMARLATGDVAGAERATEEALRLGTTDAVLWWHAARVAKAAGKTELARNRAAMAVRLNPRFDHRDATLSAVTPLFR
ncbi:MAG TPA: tetratricopeptide repeat protein [Gemmatimonadaceae bacterium]|nr:tetratricopeptide repeat protein [Gemmatimonadaceae bacterium]